jgi:hypothetical protein
MFDSGVCVLKFLNFLFDLLMAAYNCYNVGEFSHIICAVTGMVREAKTSRVWVI